MARASQKLQIEQAPEAQEDFRDHSGDRSQAETGAPALQPVAPPPPLAPTPQGLSIETAERLRQILGTDKLTSESELIELVRDGLAKQYRRGLRDGVAQAGKDPRRVLRRESRKDGRTSSWELHRRALRKRRFKNVLATLMMLLISGTAIVVVASVFHPTLSADSVNARKPR